MNSVSLLFKGHSRKSRLDVVKSKCGLCTEEQVSSNRAVQAVLHHLCNFFLSPLWLERTGKHLVFKVVIILRWLSLCVNYLQKLLAICSLY